MASKKKNIEHCTVVQDGNDIYWINLSGIKVFTRKSGTIGYDTAIDLRRAAPYWQIIPCPYCEVDDVEDNTPHHASVHVNPLLGEKF